MKELSAAQLEATLKELEQKLERLRVTYEQYFLGIVKREPLVQLKEVVRILRELDQQPIRNTATRFRLRRAGQKFNTHRARWKRTQRAIDAGTHRVDVARVKRKFAAQGVEMPDLGHAPTAAQVEKALSEASLALQEKTAQGATLSEPVAEDRGPAQPSMRAQAIPEETIRSLYRRFIKAKKLCGEEADSVSYEGLNETLQRAFPKLRKDHPGQDIDFQVVIRKGKAVLKACPKS